MSRVLIIGMAVFALLVAKPDESPAAAVDVFAEGAYTETGTVVEISADITPAVLSYGIRLTYDTGQLAVTGAEKNESVWYLGDGATGNRTYAGPDIATPGEVAIIGGKLDTAAPTAGVSGQRVLLGRVTFSRTGTSIPLLNLTFAKDPGTGYANFVSTDGTVLDNDNVNFAVRVVERGDANGDGRITPVDINAVKRYIGSTTFPVYADCNGDERMTPTDVNCVKSRIR